MFKIRDQLLLSAIEVEEAQHLGAPVLLLFEVQFQHNFVILYAKFTPKERCQIFLSLFHQLIDLEVLVINPFLGPLDLSEPILQIRWLLFLITGIPLRFLGHCHLQFVLGLNHRFELRSLPLLVADFAALGGAVTLGVQVAALELQDALSNLEDVAAFDLGFLGITLMRHKLLKHFLDSKNVSNGLFQEYLFETLIDDVLVLPSHIVLADGLGGSDFLAIEAVARRQVA